MANFYYESNGAFTGEVSLELLKDAGCGFALIGHSERRSMFGESDDAINKKVHRAMDLGITAVVCVGETLAQRKAELTLDIIGARGARGRGPLSVMNPKRHKNISCASVRASAEIRIGILFVRPLGPCFR